MLEALFAAACRKIMRSRRTEGSRGVTYLQGGVIRDVRLQDMDVLQAFNGGSEVCGRGGVAHNGKNRCVGSFGLSM